MCWFLSERPPHRFLKFSIFSNYIVITNSIIEVEFFRDIYMNINKEVALLSTSNASIEELVAVSDEIYKTLRTPLLHRCDVKEYDKYEVLGFTKVKNYDGTSATLIEMQKFAACKGTIAKNVRSMKEYDLNM